VGINRLKVWAFVKNVWLKPEERKKKKHRFGGKKNRKEKGFGVTGTRALTLASQLPKNNVKATGRGVEKLLREVRWAKKPSLQTNKLRFKKATFRNSWTTPP